ncbi:unnamed protein product, partial [Iphiclides podalirius]
MINKDGSRVPVYKVPFEDVAVTLLLMRIRSIIIPIATILVPDAIDVPRNICSEGGVVILAEKRDAYGRSFNCGDHYFCDPGTTMACLGLLYYMVLCRCNRHSKRHEPHIERQILILGNLSSACDAESWSYTQWRQVAAASTPILQALTLKHPCPVKCQIAIAEPIESTKETVSEVIRNTRANMAASVPRDNARSNVARSRDSRPIQRAILFADTLIMRR